RRRLCRDLVRAPRRALDLADCFAFYQAKGHVSADGIPAPDHRLTPVFVFKEMRAREPARSVAQSVERRCNVFPARCFSRSIASAISLLASCASPQPTTFTHLPGSRSL